MIFLCILWINTAGKRYWQPIEEMYEDRNGAVSAQNLIYAYQEELWDTNWRELEGADQAKEPADGFRQSQEMVKLQKELTELGYHFSVFLDGESLYSNITEEEWPQLYRMIGSVPSLAHSVMVGNDDISVIKCSFYENGQECVVVAFSNAGENIAEGQNYFQRHVIPYI